MTYQLCVTKPARSHDAEGLRRNSTTALCSKPLESTVRRGASETLTKSSAS